MAWQPNKPLAGDLLNQSQADLRGNFQALDTYISPNTPTLNMVTLAAPPAAAAAGAWNIFTALGTSGNAELNLQDEIGNTYPITQSGLTATGFPAGRPQSNGWCYLPCGILVFWASVAAGGAVTINFNAGTAANFPGFTNVYTAWTEMFGPAGNPNAISYISNLIPASVTIQVGTVGTISHVTVLAIGD